MSRNEVISFSETAIRRTRDTLSNYSKDLIVGRKRVLCGTSVWILQLRLARLILRNEIDENMMTAADDAFDATISRPARPDPHVHRHPWRD